MNMRKTIPLLVIASMAMALLPSVSAAPTIALSVSVGPVGTAVTVSGTIDTYNGVYTIYFDANGTNPAGAVWPVSKRLTNGTASGYAYSATIYIPNAYAGAKKVHVADMSAVPNTSVDAFFTVQTTWTLSTTSASIFYEGGPVVYNATVTGGAATYNGALDLRVRTIDPAATVTTGASNQNMAATVGRPGWFNWAAYTLGPQSAVLALDGAYSAYLDWDLANAFPTSQQGVASTTYTIGVTSKTSYGRTDPIKMSAKLSATTWADRWELTDPNGVVTTLIIANTTLGGWTAQGPLVQFTTAKDSPLGTYTLKLKQSNTGTTVKAVTFQVTPAAFTVTYNFFGDDKVLPYGNVGRVGANSTTQRTLFSQIKFTLTYPDTTPAAQLDFPNGFSVGVYANKTLVNTINITPLTGFDGTNWIAKWTIPKDATAGKNYSFNITANSITDVNGNVGPKKSSSKAYFTVAKAVLKATTPQLVNLIAGAQIQRTMTAQVSTIVTYPDGSKVTDVDFLAGNATATATIIALNSGMYNSGAGLWVLGWKIPYKQALGAYSILMPTNQFKDKYGNKGPAADTAASGVFNVIAATITISGMTTTDTNYQSDQQATVTWTAKYPSGDPVTTKAASLKPVNVTDPNGVLIAGSPFSASYDAVSGMWSSTFIIPTGSLSGTYNATIAANKFKDDAAVANMGPTAKKYANFDVARVSLTEVLAATVNATNAAKLAETKADAAATAATAAKTAADAASAAAATAGTKADAAAAAATTAGTKADAAATAATAAGSKADAAATAANGAKSSADAAKASADAAGTKADAATAAANAAKASADSAASAANNLTTLVYGAIGASIVAALAAIVALMQISRKIA